MITYNYMRLCVYDVIHIWTYDLRDTGAMLYQLSYEQPCRKQVKSKFNLYLLYEETEKMCIWCKSYIWTVDIE